MTTPRIVACGHCTTTSGVAAYSDDDGVTWTQITSALDDGLMRDVCWDDPGQQFVMVGSSPAWWTGTADGRMIQTSPDGAAWTARTTPADDPLGNLRGPRAVAAGNGVIVALCAARSPFAYDTIVSTDGGATWATHALPITDGLGNETLSDVVFADGKFMLCAGNSAQVTIRWIWESTDGVTWSSLGGTGAPAWASFTAPPQTAIFDGTNWVFSWFNQPVTGADSGDWVYDGSSWAFHRYLAGYNGGGALAFGSGVYLVAGRFADYFTSSDAATWANVNGATDYPSGPANLDALFTGTAFVVGSDGTVPIARTTDTVTWTAPTNPMSSVFGLAIMRPVPAAGNWTVGAVRFRT